MIKLADRKLQLREIKREAAEECLGRIELI
jgi:hypothetical protein